MQDNSHGTRAPGTLHQHSDIRQRNQASLLGSSSLVYCGRLFDGSRLVLEVRTNSKAVTLLLQQVKSKCDSHCLG